ncbi:hypothetical protein [Streptomyces sp. NPDC102360]|uniref:hypothetical protein n=1 Tax=Streptomyces sp. NPDC102360 TaxID=3366160 RepID=UPI00380CB1B2
MRQHLANRSQFNHVFTSTQGKLLCRSIFQRCVWSPAVHGHTFSDGTTWKPVKPGLTFHGLRHSHKTWLIEDDIPDVVQDRRLDHTLDDHINDIYSHVADTLNTRILTALEQRWQHSIAAADAAWTPANASMVALLVLPFEALAISLLLMELGWLDTCQWIRQPPCTLRQHRRTQAKLFGLTR